MARVLPGVSIVILNFNTKELLARFLPGVLASSYANITVWLADNGSSDGSLELVQSKFPEVRTLDLKQNFGYAGGYNEALAQITDDYYVLLNSDVEVTSNWLEPLVDLAESDIQIASIQPKILDQRNKDLFEYAGASGGFLDKFYYPFCRGRMFDTMERDEGQYNDAKEIFWATGACMFIRAEAFHKVGGLDFDFFAHMEEIDMCWSLKRLGYKHYVCPSSVVYHMGGGTLANGTPRKYFLNYRNNLIMMIKNLPAMTWIWAMLWRMILDGVSAVRFLVQGKVFIVWAIMRAHFQIWRRLGYWRKKHKFVKEVSNIKVSLYPRSVVWAYFVAGKKKFSDL